MRINWVKCIVNGGIAGMATGTVLSSLGVEHVTTTWQYWVLIFTMLGVLPATTQSFEKR